MKKKDKKIKEYLKLLKKDEEWDFSYLLRLEKLKLQRMLNYFKESKIIDTTFIVREINICLHCIDIILEEDKECNYHLTTRIPAFPEKNIIPESVDFKHYVNYKNEKRFFRDNLIEKQINDTNPYRGEVGRHIRIAMYKLELRRRKALHLYNLIREYKIETWWE